MAARYNAVEYNATQYNEYTPPPPPGGLPNLGTPPTGMPARPVDRVVDARRLPSLMRAGGAGGAGRTLRLLHEIERDFEKSKRAEYEYERTRERERELVEV